MIAIHTKYIGASNTRGARIKAYTYGDNGFTVTVPYNYALNTVDAHFAAVKAMVRRFELDWELEGMRYGDSADGRGFSFCFANSTI
jgi:hypothetical protein